MKKAKVAWITDTTSSLSREFIENNNIFVVPLNVLINQVSFKEMIDITDKEFYERMEKEEGTFQSSQPSVGDFVDLYKSLKSEYDFGIAIHASSKLTGTYQTSMMAAEIAEFKIFALDSQTGSYPLSFLIKKGIELLDSGLHEQELISKLKSYRDHTRLYLVPSNLNQLHKSGRVSGTQKMLADLFKIKPILSIENGEAKIKEKVRTEKRALAWLISQLQEENKQYKIRKAAVVHANNAEQALKVQQLITESIPGLETETLMLIPVAGVHTGVGTIGLSWVCEQN
ncbi:DegV family protein with EDD domain [Peribacillus deserti]|uniref:DegV family protein with EDD domain n=1 Tax=Peribacillus deserti TaxID=673318 RepID=A0ABS2QQL5_9BACI|nr:DegV family protein [Peribacillus deserti]MBM7694526.1 DegV family protein with EDD domain [Peribacillus deserti]